MIAKLVKIAALCTAFFLVAGISAYFTLTVIIKNEEAIIVPNLVGNDVVSALELLTSLQLNTKVNGSEYSWQFPKNHVTFQEPKAGSEIKKGRDVRIILSKGAQNIFMPNLIGLSEQQARMIIEDNGISQGQLSRTHSNTIPKDHIIVQVPPAGVMITRGSAVNILVSLGTRAVEYKMPDLIGRSLEDAVLIVEKNNLAIGEIRSHFDKSKHRNIIILQEPQSGYRAIENSPVHLVINRPAGSMNKEHRHRPIYGSLLQHRITNGFLRKRVRIELKHLEVTTDRFDDYIRPGEDIWLLIPRDQETTVFIFEDDDLVKTRVFEAW